MKGDVRLVVPGATSSAVISVVRTSLPRGDADRSAAYTPSQLGFITNKSITELRRYARTDDDAELLESSRAMGGSWGRTGDAGLG